MRSQSIFSKNKGFTLLEVVLSVAFVGMVVTLLLQAYVLINFAKQEQIKTAGALAFLNQKFMEEKYSLEPLSESVVGFPGPNQEYSLEIYQGKMQEGGYQNISITISWIDRGKTQKVGITTMIQRPDNES